MRIKQRRQLLIVILGVSVSILFYKYAYHAQHAARIPNFTHVVIFSSMRSGSTFTGSLFEISPDVFYTFESAYVMHWLNTAELKYISKPTRKRRDFVTEATGVVKAVLECRFQDLDLETLTSRHYKASQHTKTYFKCIVPTWRNASRRDIAKCLHLLEKPCLASRVHVVKEIRLPMQSMDAVLGTSKSARLIHLIRDPRAAIMSQMQYGFSPSPQVYPYAKMVCTQLLEDTIYRDYLEKKYPGQIKVVYYENLAQHPISVARDLYEFTGLSFTAEVEEYVKSITSGSVYTTCTLCVYKTNSTYESLKWRMKIKWSTATIIDRVCGDVYNKLGYLPMESLEHLRSVNKPLLRSVSKGRIKS